jgi:hypothetical protein
MSMTPCDFSFAHYGACLAHASAVQATCAIEWIHDVDHFADNLLEFAALESENGVSAKYFIRLHARYYNALSVRTIETVRRLVSEYGHEIGLHFEHHLYPAEDVAAALRMERETLQFFFRVPINSVSTHLPAKCGSLEKQIIPDDMKYYCWSSEHYQGKKYISDSGGRWREGCMCQHIGQHQKMIILTHDVWWFRNTPSDNY